MNVLVVVGGWPDDETGSYTNVFVRSQVRALERLGHRMTVWNLADYGRGMAKYAAGAVRVRQMLASSHADLIHAHYGYCGWVATLQRDRPVVISFMGSDVLSPQHSDRRASLELAVNRRVARRAAGVIVKSDSMRQALALGAAEVIPNGVDFDDFRPMTRQEARARLGWPATGHVVLFPACPGRPEKNYPLAAEAVAQAARLCGADIRLATLCDIPPSHVPLFLNASDVVIMTSTSEGSPNVVKEALACDVSVVSVPVGDVEAMLAGVEGCAVVGRDPGVLAHALVAQLSTGERPAGRQALIDRGLDVITVARRIETIYDNAAAASRGA